MAYLFPATPGTVSHSTLRSRDLIEAFSDELSLLVRSDSNRWETADDIRLRNEWLSTVDEARDYLRILALGEESPDEEIVIEILEQLTEGLEFFAPEGYYFGSHFGDGADFGFWPIDDDDDDDDDFVDGGDYGDDVD